MKVVVVVIFPNRELDRCRIGPAGRSPEPVELLSGPGVIGREHVRGPAVHVVAIRYAADRSIPMRAPVPGREPDATTIVVRARVLQAGRQSSPDHTPRLVRVTVCPAVVQLAPREVRCAAPACEIRAARLRSDLECVVLVDDGADRIVTDRQELDSILGAGLSESYVRGLRRALMPRVERLTRATAAAVLPLAIMRFAAECGLPRPEANTLAGFLSA